MYKKDKDKDDEKGYDTGKQAHNGMQPWVARQVNRISATLLRLVPDAFPIPRGRLRQNERR
jgi:hypothetical protein